MGASTWGRPTARSGALTYESNSNSEIAHAEKPTIATVAAQAGVAVSTVSRYLNGHYVSREVRARLSDIIAELGYSRSWTARNLSLGRRGSIGVVVDSSNDPWFVQLLTGIEEELSTRDTSLMLASTELRSEYDPALVFEWIRERRVDGLIIAKSQRRERSLFKAAVDAGLPTVAVVPDENVTHVQVLRSNNLAAGMLVAHHLADLGHRHIGFVGGPKHSIDSQHRERGLREGLAKACPARPGARFAATILPGVFRVDDPCVRLRLAPEGRHALEQILDGLRPEVFAADDALGWVYQFWQKDKKDEVNASERKIGGADLGPVTQLFTENYMVRFLLENSSERGGQADTPIVRW